MSQSPTRIILSQARVMIQNPDHWLQGSWKQPIEGGGFRRCAYQAVYDAAKDLGLPEAAAMRALTRVIADGRRSPRRTIPGFNDRASHKDVLAMFDLALENA